MATKPINIDRSQKRELSTKSRVKKRERRNGILFQTTAPQQEKIIQTEAVSATIPLKTYDFAPVVSNSYLRTDEKRGIAFVHLNAGDVREVPVELF